MSSPVAVANIQGPKILHPQVFSMIRKKDETGVSGTGTVLDGIVFPSGKCTTQWRGAMPCVSTWDSFDQFKRIHIDSHPANETEVIWFNVSEPQK